MGVGGRHGRVSSDAISDYLSAAVARQAAAVAGVTAPIAQDRYLDVEQT